MSEMRLFALWIAVRFSVLESLICRLPATRQQATATTTIRRPCRSVGNRLPGSRCVAVALQRVPDSAVGAPVRLDRLRCDARPPSTEIVDPAGSQAPSWAFRHLQSHASHAGQPWYTRSARKYATTGDSVRQAGFCRKACNEIQAAVHVYLRLVCRSLRGDGTVRATGCPIVTQ